MFAVRGEGYAQCGQEKMGVNQARTSALFGVKNYEFLKIYGVSARAKGGLASAEILRTRGEVVNFCDFADSYGRSLNTTYSINHQKVLCWLKK